MARHDDVLDALGAVTRTLEAGGEHRGGQDEMCDAVAGAIGSGRNLVVQAGTGTGKSLAYLVPAALSGRRVVVATATKALQDQLAGSDLPRVRAGLGERARFEFAVLKGRNNYLCVQRAGESAPAAPEGPGEGPGVTPTERATQVRRIREWAETTVSGDRADLPFEPDAAVWASLSISARDCPGAFRCPSGEACFAEAARRRAAAADIVVVNTHLYGAHLASDGAVLPEHDTVVFDEAHELEDILTDTLGSELTAARFRTVATAARALLPRERAEDAQAVADVGDAIERLIAHRVGERIPAEELTPAVGSRAAPPELEAALTLARSRLERVVAALRDSDPRQELSLGGDTGQGDDAARRDRTVVAAGHLMEDVAAVLAADEDVVVHVAGSPRSPRLECAPIDVAPILAARLWGQATAVLTSATIPDRFVERLGLDPDLTDELDVGSPFDYAAHALLYVPTHLPDRRDDSAEPAIHEELAALIEASGGRALCLFTSRRAMLAAADALRERVDVPILVQGDLPKPALLEAFAADEATCLVATMGFWQGVDVPGRTLSLVTVDRLPFARPDDPVAEARRERAGPAAFSTVDLPRAGMLLAQGAGRLIRRADDRGVVAVFDTRLATASYRGRILAHLPPMKRTTSRDEVVAFLSAIARSAEPV